MVKLIKKKRVLRNLSGKSMSKANPEPQYSVPTQRIMALRHYPKIVASLKRGQSSASIVRWFERNDWLGDMSPSTFSQYLSKFKNECPELISSHAPDESVDTYDKVVGADIPAIDVDNEIDKLIQVQKTRISIDFKTEREMNKLLDNTHKEINTLGELLRLKKGMEKSGLAQQGESSARDSTTLRELRVSEDSEDRMQGLASALFTQIKHASKKKARRAQTVRATR